MVLRATPGFFAQPGVLDYKDSNLLACFISIIAYGNTYYFAAFSTRWPRCRSRANDHPLRSRGISHCFFLARKRKIRGEYSPFCTVRWPDTCQDLPTVPELAVKVIY